MTNEEAKDYLYNHRKAYMEFVNTDRKLIDKHNTVMDMAIEALDKQIARAPEPQERTNRYNEPTTEWFCPTCGCLVDKDDDVYCSYCGQRLENV